MTQKQILAIHDISCVGRCSLTVALPILSVAGFATSVLPTAVLSTHTGFDGFTYRDLTEDIPNIANHWTQLGLKFDAMYSGFLGSYAQIDLVAGLYRDFKAQGGLILVDPVMADNGALYSVFTNQMVEGMAKLCQCADIIVPNLTEACLLLNRPYIGADYNKEYITEMVQSLAKFSGAQVVLTGVSFTPGRIGAVCYHPTSGELDYVDNLKIEGHFAGTGDIFASGLLAGIENGFSLTKSAQIAVDYTYLSIKHCIEIGNERKYGVAFERAIPSLIQLLEKGEG